MTDQRNKTERLLNELMDHIAATGEQPGDLRAWSSLLIYAPGSDPEAWMRDDGSAATINPATASQWKTWGQGCVPLYRRPEVSHPLLTEAELRACPRSSSANVRQ